MLQSSFPLKEFEGGTVILALGACGWAAVGAAVDTTVLELLGKLGIIEIQKQVLGL